MLNGFCGDAFAFAQPPTSKVSPVLIPPKLWEIEQVLFGSPISFTALSLPQCPVSLQIVFVSLDIDHPCRPFSNSPFSSKLSSRTVCSYVLTRLFKPFAFLEYSFNVTSPFELKEEIKSPLLLNTLVSVSPVLLLIYFIWYGVYSIDISAPFVPAVPYSFIPDSLFGFWL